MTIFRTILTAAHCLCTCADDPGFEEDVDDDEKSIPCRLNKNNPKSYQDYTDQQMREGDKVKSWRREIYYVVGEAEIDSGTKTHWTTDKSYKTIFDENRNARHAIKAMVMDTKKKGKKVIRGSGHDIGLIQMQLWDVCLDMTTGTKSIGIPNAPIPQ